MFNNWCLIYNTSVNEILFLISHHFVFFIWRNSRSEVGPYLYAICTVRVVSYERQPVELCSCSVAGRPCWLLVAAASPGMISCSLPGPRHLAASVIIYNIKDHCFFIWHDDNHPSDLIVIVDAEDSQGRIELASLSR